MRLTIILALIACVPRLAAADNKAVAKEAYREGSRQYDLGDYGKALDLFKKAYLNYEDPVILFNIAQCQRQLGDKPEAVKLYRSFLRKIPGAPNHLEVEHIIQRLETEIAQEEASKKAPPQTVVTPEKQPQPIPTPPAPPLTPPERTRLYKKWWLWTTVGVVVVGVGLGVGLGLGLNQAEKFNPTLDGFGPGMKSMALGAW